jgi:CRISPR-associated protein Csm3
MEETKTQTMKLIDTKILKGTITLETGLHIGGTKTSLAIGSLDSPVIKTSQGVPYIPGSSLKGKIRTLLAMKEGSKAIESDSPQIKKMFGYPGKGKEGDGAEIARLIFRDSMLQDNFKELFKDAELETIYTEAKYENRINRSSGKASDPRQIERVPAGAEFHFEVVINKFDGDMEDFEAKLREGIELLENNYLGGSGTRGYGKVKFDIK